MLSFKLDSVYKPIECSGYDLFDPTGGCFAFGGEEIGIYIRVWSLEKGTFLDDDDLTKSATTISYKVRGAFPDRNIQKPEIISSDFMEGIVVKSSRGNINSVNYFGYDKHMLVGLNIIIEPVDASIDTNQLFSDLIQSLSVSVKK
jgi:hypothetical protein